jgi:hypothetical protein
MGKLAMDTMAERQQRWRERSERGLKLKTSHTVNSAVEMAINEETEGTEKDTMTSRPLRCHISCTFTNGHSQSPIFLVDILDTKRVKLDLKPLYQCLHIYDELGQRAEFRTSYAEDRRAQAKLTLSSINSSFNLKDRNTNFRTQSQVWVVLNRFTLDDWIILALTPFLVQWKLAGRTL